MQSTGDRWGQGGATLEDQNPSKWGHFRVSDPGGEIEENPEAIREAKRHEGLYILATNVLDAQRLPAASMWALYKSQTGSVERGFRFLKDPLFFASGVYLQKPERIMALLMVMTLSLLIYALAEESLRRELKRQKATLPDQKGKPTERPTLRRIFQVFEGIYLLEIRVGESIQRRITNLREIHRKILEYLPMEVKMIYFPDEGCGR